MSKTQEKRIESLKKQLDYAHRVNCKLLEDLRNAKLWQKKIILREMRK